MIAGSSIQKPIHRHILGMRVDLSSYSDATDRVISAAEAPDAFWLCPAGVHTVVEAHRSLSMGNAMASASLVTTDGMPLVWSLKWLGVGNAERVYGPTLTERVLDMAESRGIPVGFYGGSPDTLRAMLGKCRKRWGGLTIAYACSPPFRHLTHEEDLEIIRQVIGSGTRILFVGLGCPKQELWACNHYQALNIPILAVGAAFDFIAGVKRQAPGWMQRLGLEWFFRLLTEPRRLWRRYLFGNPYFVLLLLMQLTGLRRFGRPENKSVR